MRPPKTSRFCVVCDCMTVWEYNPGVFHSECVVCGSRFGRRFKPNTVVLINGNV